MEIQVLTFAEAKQPEYKEKKGEGYMQYGQNNDYPQYLLDLFNKSAKHNAIIRGKVNYIVGNGWAGEQAIVQKVNREETLNDLTKKVALLPQMSILVFPLLSNCECACCFVFCE